MKTIKFLFLMMCLTLMISLGLNAQDSNKKGDVYTVVEKMPEFPGGQDAMISFIGNNLKYPEVAKKDGIQGKVHVSFIIDEKGTVRDAKIEKSASPTLDKEALRVINSMPAWKPGIEKGKVVKVAFTLPINFVLDNQLSKGPDKNGVYNTVEEMPSFQGGDAALRDYIIKNVVYPDDAKKAGIQGKVYVSFVVDEKGAVTDVKVIKSASPSLDKEAFRVMSAMPKWNPGKEKGKAVKVQFTMPVNFALK
jgi:TonB family protein